MRLIDCLQNAATGDRVWRASTGRYVVCMKSGDGEEWFEKVFQILRRFSNTVYTIWSRDRITCLYNIMI